MQRSQSSLNTIDEHDIVGMDDNTPLLIAATKLSKQQSTMSSDDEDAARFNTPHGIGYQKSGTGSISNITMTIMTWVS